MFKTDRQMHGRFPGNDEGPRYLVLVTLAEAGSLWAEKKKVERFGCSLGTFRNNLQEISNISHLGKRNIYIHILSGIVRPSWITSPSPCHFLQQAETLRWLARSASWSNDAGFALKSLNGRSLEVPWPPHDESLVKLWAFWHIKSWLWDGSDDFCWHLFLIGKLFFQGVNLEPRSFHGWEFTCPMRVSTSTVAATRTTKKSCWQFQLWMIPDAVFWNIYLQYVWERLKSSNHCIVARKDCKWNPSKKVLVKDIFRQFFVPFYSWNT